MTGSSTAGRVRLPRLRIFVRLVGAVLVLCAMFVLARKFLDVREAVASLSGLDRRLLAPIALLTVGYYVLKAVRWHYYLVRAGVAVSLGRALAAYLAGQWFTFTPAGELMRVYFLGAGSNFGRVAPTVVMQAGMDFVSLALVATVAVALHPALAPVVLPLTLPLLLTVGMLACPPLRRFASTWRLVRWLAVGSRHAALEQTMRLLTPRPIAVGLLLGVPAVLAGAGALCLSGIAIGIPGANAIQAGAVYAMMQLVGGISPLPQGLGVTEGTGTFLLSFTGVDSSLAVATIIVFRAATLGLSAGLGLIAFVLLRFTAPPAARAGVRPRGALTLPARRIAAC